MVLIWYGMVWWSIAAVNRMCDVDGSLLELIEPGSELSRLFSLKNELAIAFFVIILTVFCRFSAMPHPRTRPACW